MFVLKLSVFDILIKQTNTTCYFFHPFYLIRKLILDVHLGFLSLSLSLWVPWNKNNFFFACSILCLLLYTLQQIWGSRKNCNFLISDLTTHGPLVVIRRKLLQVRIPHRLVESIPTIYLVVIQLPGKFHSWTTSKQCHWNWVFLSSK